VIDEGTTGVKAALFDEQLRSLREARRDNVNRHLRAGWVEQDGEEVLTAVVEAVAELLEDAPGEVAACGLDHKGESVLAWDAESGAPLTPIVVWQDKRSQEVLDRLGAHEQEIQQLSGLPFDPYFSAAKLAWLLENDEGCSAPASRAPCGWARSTRSCATGSGPASRPTRPPRPGPSSTRLERLASTPASASSSACRWTCCQRCAPPPAI
jgi:glycerol kinase